jgi:hypothetical protein
MIRIIRYYLNTLAWSLNVLTLLDASIFHLVYSKCNPFVMDGGIVCNMKGNFFPHNYCNLLYMNL